MGELTIAQTGPITTLNMDAASSVVAEYEALTMVADSLWTMNASGQLVPDIASSVSRSNGGRTWTFHIRKGAVFSNGKPVTSKDVKFSVQWEQKQPLQGGNYKEITSIATPNPGTVSFTTKAPDVTFLTKMATYNVAVIPYDFAGENEKTFWQHPIACGAFTVESFQPGVKMVLRRNPKYFWADRVHAKMITLEPVTDTNTAMLKLENGSINVIDSLPTSEVASLQGRPNVTLRQVPGGAAYFLVLNSKSGPFANQQVRQAVSLALNRQAMVSEALLGHGTEAGSWLASEPLGGWQPALGSRYDLAAAKADLAKTPYKSGFTATFPYTSTDPVATTAAQQIQSDLAALHIRLQLRGENANAVSQAQASGNFGVSFGTIFWNGDPAAVFQYYVATKGFYSFDSANVEHVNGLLSKALTMFDDVARMKLYREMATSTAVSANNIGLIQPYQYIATSGNVASVPTGAGTSFYQFATFK